MKTYEDLKKDLKNDKALFETIGKEIKALAVDKKDTEKYTQSLVSIAKKHGYEISVEDISLSRANEGEIDPKEAKMVAGGDPCSQQLVDNCGLDQLLQLRDCGDEFWESFKSQPNPYQLDQLAFPGEL